MPINMITITIAVILYLFQIGPSPEKILGVSTSKGHLLIMLYFLFVGKVDKFMKMSFKTLVYEN